MEQTKQQIIVEIERWKGVKLAIILTGQGDDDDRLAKIDDEIESLERKLSKINQE